MDKIAWLVPNIQEFSTQPFDSQLSAVFVVALWSITFIFLAISTNSYFRARKRIKWLRMRLSGVSTETISSKRQGLHSDAKKEKKVDLVGHLWLEFDETLIEVKEAEVRLYNTFDAAHFFNSTTLAGGVTDNRLIAAVPGFLTAIGVIGTFVGLQIGLSEINISSNVSVAILMRLISGC